MATEGQTFEHWLHGAKVRPERLSDNNGPFFTQRFSFFNGTRGTTPLPASPVTSCFTAAWD